MEHRWNDIDKRKPKHSDKTLSQFYVVSHKSHMNFLGDRTRYVRFGIQLCRPLRNVSQGFITHTSTTSAAAELSPGLTFRSHLLPPRLGRKARHMGKRLCCTEGRTRGERGSLCPSLPLVVIMNHFSLRELINPEDGVACFSKMLVRVCRAALQ